MTEEKKSSGAGKFILGAAIGAMVGAIAGKFISVKGNDEECDCDCDCDCDNHDHKEAAEPVIEAEIKVGTKAKEAKKDEAKSKTAKAEDKPAKEAENK